MCCGSLFKTALLIGVAVAAIATVVSLLTPQWRRFDTDGNHQQFYKGLLSTLKSLNFNITKLENYFKTRKDYEKTVMILLIVALIAELVTIAWMIVGCFTCCCCKITKPIPFLILGTTICLAVGIIIYSVNNGESVDKLFSNSSATFARLKASFGYSYWLAVLATAIMGLSTVISVVAYCIC